MRTRRTHTGGSVAARPHPRCARDARPPSTRPAGGGAIGSGPSTPWSTRVIRIDTRLDCRPDWSPSAPSAPPTTTRATSPAQRRSPWFRGKGRCKPPAWRWGTSPGYLPRQYGVDRPPPDARAAGLSGRSQPEPARSRRGTDSPFLGCNRATSSRARLQSRCGDISPSARPATRGAGIGTTGRGIMAIP